MPATAPVPVLGAPPAPNRAPHLVDFCAARAARDPGGRVRQAWLVFRPETAEAVSTWRRGQGLTQVEAAKAAGVSGATWSRIEAPRPNRAELAAPIWQALSWIMSQGGPAFDLGD